MVSPPAADVVGGGVSGPVYSQNYEDRKARQEDKKSKEQAGIEQTSKAVREMPQSRARGMRSECP